MAGAVHGETDDLSLHEKAPEALFEAQLDLTGNLTDRQWTPLGKKSVDAL